MPRKTSKTRKRKGKGRKEDVAALMKEVLPEIPAERVAEFEEIIPRRFNFRSQDKKWRREDEFRAYHQNPKNIGLGFPFTAEQVVRYYADGFRNSEVRPDGLEKTLPGDTKEWYMLLPGGGWGNYPHEREGPFSANEIGDSIFTNTKLVDRSIAEENWRPQTLSAYLRGEGRMVDLADGSRPRTTLGFRPAGALHALRTERDRFERGWLRGGKKRKTRKRKGGGRKEDVAAVMQEWQPIEGKPTLPLPPAENIAGQVEAMEEKKRFNFGRFDRKFKKHGDGLLSRGLSDAKSIADLHHTPHEKDVKDWFLENGGQSEGPFSPKEIGNAVFKDTEDKSLFEFLYYHPSRAWARRGGRRKTKKTRKTKKRKTRKRKRN